MFVRSLKFVYYVWLCSAYIRITVYNTIKLLLKRLIANSIWVSSLKIWVVWKKDDLEGLLNIVRKVSDDIGMQFGLDKCVKVTFKKVSQANSKNITLNVNMEITVLEHNKTNKY